MLRRQIPALFILLAVVFAAAPAAAATVTVRVNDNFFSPQDITITAGDTVQWRNVTGNGHNVVSCFPGQFGCNDQMSDTVFSSGAASPFFNYSFTFNEPGYNPYICQPHAPFMIGSVTVIASTPPVVPDGNADAPMTVRPRDDRSGAGGLAGARNARRAIQRVRAARPVEVQGTSLQISWSTAGCPGAGSYHLVYGGGADLPSAPGGTFRIQGWRCALSGSTYLWTAPPDPTVDPKGLIWWLVIADDAAAMEGSWGTDSQSLERTGPAPDGASGVCGMVQKSVGNTCGR